MVVDEEAETASLTSTISKLNSINSKKPTNIKYGLLLLLPFLLISLLIVLSLNNNEDENEGETSSNINYSLGVDEQQEEHEDAVDLVKELILPPEEPTNLDEIKCIPKVCSTMKHFISEDPHSFVLLASFPGSGNTWSRRLVEEGTRVWTGSVYHDKGLIEEGFEGEKVNPYVTKTEFVSGIKTHFPYYSKPRIEGKTTAVIHILRSPFDSLLAEFALEKGRGGDKHKAHIYKSMLQDMYREWFDMRSPIWPGFMHYWLGKQWVEKFAKKKQVTDGVTSYLLHRNFWGTHSKNDSIPVLYLYYEDLISNFEVTLGQMYTFLKTFLKDSMPDVKTALICAIRHNQQEELSRRHHREDEFNIYSDVRMRPAINLFCRRAKPYWDTEMWGDCHDAIPMRSRNITFKKSPVLPIVECTEN